MSLQGAGTDEASVIEILCARPNAEIRAIKEAYTTGLLPARRQDNQTDGKTDRQMDRHFQTDIHANGICM